MLSSEEDNICTFVSKSTECFKPHAGYRCGESHVSGETIPLMGEAPTTELHFGGRFHSSIYFTQKRSPRRTAALKRSSTVSDPVRQKPVIASSSGFFMHLYASLVFEGVRNPF